MPAMTRARRNALAGIVIATVLGALIATMGGDGGEELGGLPTFAWLVIIAFGVNVAVFVPSFLAKTEHYYDLTGSITYLTVTIVALITADDRDLRTVLFAVLIVCWAGRLGTFLFRRVRRDGGDGRFDKIKVDFLRFLMAWMVQGLWVTLTAGAPAPGDPPVHLRIQVVADSPAPADGPGSETEQEAPQEFDRP